MPAYSLFPLADYWWFYGLFIVGVLGVLALDLGVFHRKAHEVSAREALVWCGIWMSLALLFAFGLWQYCQWKFPQDPRLLAAGMTAVEASKLANQTVLEFLTGYVIEQSLSVDNMFVFVVIFNFFAIPRKYQHRVLFFGILGALVFRIAFISLGAALMRWEWVLWVFGVFLIFTGLKLLFGKEKPLEPDKNPVIRFLRRMIPITNSIDDDRFLLRREGILYATPLFVCLVFIEITDIVFAVDSVPAIFAITREPLVVFTSNAFAILGLRSLYFLLSGVMHKFWALRYGLGVILLFVGLKMVWLNHLYGGKFPIGISLGVIAGVLAAAVVVSLAFPQKEEAAH